MLSVDEFDDGSANPLEILEFIVGQNEWPYERIGNEEIVAAITGDWCDFHMRYLWMADKYILQCSGQLDIRVGDKKRADILQVINLINERLDMGYFSIWNDDDTIMFRTSFVPATNAPDVAASCDMANKVIIAEINRYFPVFQFIIWGGKTPKEALEATMIDTVGNA